VPLSVPDVVTLTVVALADAVCVLPEADGVADCVGEGVALDVVVSDAVGVDERDGEADSDDAPDDEPDAVVVAELEFVREADTDDAPDEVCDCVGARVAVGDAAPVPLRDAVAVAELEPVAEADDDGVPEPDDDADGVPDAEDDAAAVAIAVVVAPPVAEGESARRRPPAATAGASATASTGECPGKRSEIDSAFRAPAATSRPGDVGDVVVVGRTALLDAESDGTGVARGRPADAGGEDAIGAEAAADALPADGSCAARAAIVAKTDSRTAPARRRSAERGAIDASNRVSSARELKQPTLEQNAQRPLRATATAVSREGNCGRGRDRSRENEAAEFHDKSARTSLSAAPVPFFLLATGPLARHAHRTIVTRLPGHSATHS